MSAETKKFRIEHDSIGQKGITRQKAYYGVQTLRAAENFYITGLTMHPELINSVAQIKKAAAITNYEVGRLDKKRADAIVKACDEILEGKFPISLLWIPSRGEPKRV